jgi:hypothetical protein
MLHLPAFLADLWFECDDDKCEEVILSYHTKQAITIIHK